MHNFFHTLSPSEKLGFINGDPQAFEEGLFSVPAEIFSDDELEMTQIEINAKGYAFLIGRTLGRNLAMKNGRVIVNSGVENE